jgi:hypothetical protein
MIWIYAWRSGVQIILAGARVLSLLQNIQTSSSAHQAPKSSFFSGSKVARADSQTTHSCLGPSIKISGVIPPLNLSASMAHVGTTLFYLYLLPMNIFLKRSHHSGLKKEHFYALLSPYMHTTWHNYFIFIDPITVSWTAAITNFIIQFPVSFCY